MPLPSFSSGLVYLPCIFRSARSSRIQHVLKHHLHTSAIRRLETAQADASSIPQDLNIIYTKSKKQKTSKVQVDPVPDSVQSSSIPHEAPSEINKAEVVQIQHIYKRLSLKIAELESADSHDLSFADLVEELATVSKIKSVRYFSRLSSLYGKDDAPVALQKVQTLLAMSRSKASITVDRQREHLEYVGILSPPKQFSDEQIKLKKSENKIYVQLLARIKKPGETVPEHRLRTVQRKKATPVRKLISPVKVRRVRDEDPAPVPVPAPAEVQMPDFTDGSSGSASIPEIHRSPEKPPVQREQPPVDAQITDTAFIAQKAVNIEDTQNVPTLSFDLSRVLFNPGVYHLQDPRSRVFNFDPYLQNITPVNEFNWGALNTYITSSEDHHLRDIAIKQKKRYVGSSSSMSGALSQFHFLLSAWRPLDFSTLSKKMEGLTSFTAITRAPASIFLRHRDGIYAVDADKEHDTPNILMMHGRSMEKLLTNEKEEFEKYKLPREGKDTPIVDAKPESYHYSTVENFLLRSQLDAHDPRLPGTGMFDLKTRAVAGVRMYLSNHESGMTYQIKDRFGLWESYEREYYDMIRAAFLKYSLQVRMGRMDGIFVAYHNIARIFGFQYIPISELDQALHGQADPTVGNREFRMSIKLMGEIFDQATKACPGQSLRLMFETREPPSGSEYAPIFMRIFAEVVTEEEIETLQAAGKEVMEDYEDNMARGIKPQEDAKATKAQRLEEKISIKATPSTLDSTLADTAFLDNIFGKSIDAALQSPPQKESEAEVENPKPEAAQEEDSARTVLCWKLSIYNNVNGHLVDRPERITSNDRWDVHYKIEQVTQGVQGLYNSVKNKRRNMLTFDEDGDAPQSWFLKHIVRLNESGKKWRAQQDEMDAEKEQVVLYSKST